ncbi:rhodopsin, G0-coupled-like [Branchiostoma floridae x Branchiostoma belcheri]
MVENSEENTSREGFVPLSGTGCSEDTTLERPRRHSTGASQLGAGNIFIMIPANNTTDHRAWSLEHGVSATIMGVYLTIVGLVATVGNATVVLMFILKWRQLCRKAPNLLVINLAAANLCVTIFGYPFSALSGYAHQWLFSDAICTLYGFSCFVLSIVSMHTLCLISVHRYITICRPEHASKLTMSRTILAVIGAWLVAIAVAVPPLFGIARYTYEPFGLSCTIDFRVTTVADLVYLICLIVLCYVINVVIMGTCYFKIIRKFSKQRFRQVRDIRTSYRRSFEMGVTLRCILMVLFYLVSWTPYTALCVWTMVGPPPPVEASMAATLIAKTHCAFNPILYAFMSEVYRKLVFRTMCPCCFTRISCTSAATPPGSSKVSGHPTPDIFTVGYSSRDQAVQINRAASRRFCFVTETASEDLGIEETSFTGHIGLWRSGATVEGLGGVQVTQSPTSGSGSESSPSLLDFLPKRASGRIASAKVPSPSAFTFEQTTCPEFIDRQAAGPEQSQQDKTTRSSALDVRLTEDDVTVTTPASETWRRKMSRRTFGKSRKHAYIVD